MTYVKKNGNNVLKAIVDEKWPEAIRQAQIENLTSQGYVLLTETKMPRVHRAIGFYTPTYEITDISASQNWEFHKKHALLSQKKLLNHPIISSFLSAHMDDVKDQPDLVDWWTKNMTYYRGSEMANKAMQLFNMNQEQLEALAISCLV